MDFKKLLKGKSINDLEIICENWYSRLNKMKDKYGHPCDGIPNRKAEIIIWALINRLGYLSQVYIDVTSPRSIRYPRG